MYFTTQALHDGAIVGMLAFVILITPIAAIAGAAHLLRSTPYTRHLARKRRARRRARQQRRAQA